MAVRVLVFARYAVLIEGWSALDLFISGSASGARNVQDDRAGQRPCSADCKAPKQRGMDRRTRLNASRGRPLKPPFPSVVTIVPNGAVRQR